MSLVASTTTAQTNQVYTAGFQSLIGVFKTFGAAGPVYEVLSSISPAQGADCLMRIRVLDSGELVDLPASQVSIDPKAV
jgi:Family of unknown function (DUF5397)